MRYRTIVCDPPWAYPEGFAQTSGRPSEHARGEHGAIGGSIQKVILPYPSLSVDQIAALDLPGLAEPDCRLFLWATMRYLPEAFRLLPVWGFAYKQTIVWDKSPNFNPLGGSIAPNACEFLLVATQGKPERLGRLSSSIVTVAKSFATSQHSRKPECFLDYVEQVSPGPYLELFARRQRLGWDTWGNEALNHVELPA